MQQHLILHSYMYIELMTKSSKRKSPSLAKNVYNRLDDIACHPYGINWRIETGSVTI